MTALCRHGGHYSHNKDGPLRLFGAKVLAVPFDQTAYNIDLSALRQSLQQERPKLLVVGWSEFLFLHPLASIREACRRHGTRLMYDMSHVAGLIAGGAFQPEATQLADIVTSSTGKSLHAPDHGLCLFNDPALADAIHGADLAVPPAGAPRSSAIPLDVRRARPRGIAHPVRGVPDWLQRA